MKIGIVGLAGAGKDTFAQYLLEELGEGWSIDRYAAPLKRAAEYVFGPYFDARERKEVPVLVTESRYDRMIEAAIQLSSDLGFTAEEENKASYLFFEQFYPGVKLSPRKFQQLLGTEVVREVRESAFSDRVKSLSTNLIVPDVRFQNELLDVLCVVVREDLEPVNPHPSEAMAAEMSADVQTLGTAEFFSKWAHVRTLLTIPNYANLAYLQRLAHHAAITIKKQVLS